MVEYVSEEAVHLQQNLPLTQLHSLHPHSGHTAMEENEISEYFHIHYMLICILTTSLYTVHCATHTGITLIYYQKLAIMSHNICLRMCQQHGQKKNQKRLDIKVTYQLLVDKFTFTKQNLKYHKKNYTETMQAT
jgi:hypothetical protein